MEYLHRKQRSGKWSAEEEVYAEALIAAFHAGQLDIKEGISLRKHLSDKLQRNGKSVSKKFEGTNYNGKAHYVKNSEVTVADVMAETDQLRLLEVRFLEAVKSTPKPPALARSPPSSAAVARSSPNISPQVSRPGIYGASGSAMASQGNSSLQEPAVNASTRSLFDSLVAGGLIGREGRFDDTLVGPSRSNMTLHAHLSPLVLPTSHASGRHLQLSQEAPSNFISGGGSGRLSNSAAIPSLGAAASSFSPLNWQPPYALVGTDLVQTLLRREMLQQAMVSTSNQRQQRGREFLLLSGLNSAHQLPALDTLQALEIAHQPSRQAGHPHQRTARQSFPFVGPSPGQTLSFQDVETLLGVAGPTRRTIQAGQHPYPTTTGQALLPVLQSNGEVTTRQMMEDHITAPADQTLEDVAVAAKRVRHNK